MFATHLLMLLASRPVVLMHVYQHAANVLLVSVLLSSISGLGDVASFAKHSWNSPGCSC